jgi:hypothetical protein
MKHEKSTRYIQLKFHTIGEKNYVRIEAKKQYHNATTHNVASQKMKNTTKLIRQNAATPKVYNAAMVERSNNRNLEQSNSEKA